MSEDRISRAAGRKMVSESESAFLAKFVLPNKDFDSGWSLVRYFVQAKTEHK